MKNQIIVRRVITPLLILVFCMSVMVVPAKASESRSEEFMLNVLDYSTINDSGSNFITLPGPTASIVFKYPTKMGVYYIDALFHIRGSTVTEITGSAVGDAPNVLTVKSFDSNLYRVYGYIDTFYRDNFQFNFTTGKQSNLYIECLQFNVSGFPIKAYEDTVFMYEGPIREGEPDFIWKPGDGTLHYQAMGGYNDWVETHFWILNWERYDYFDLTICYATGSINSISADAGGVSIPLDYTIVETGMSESFYYTTVRLDFRGLDRMGSDPYLHISGLGKYENGPNDIWVMSCQGYILQTFTNPIIIWFQNVISAINSGVEEIVDAIFAANNQDQDDQMSEAASQATEIDDLIGELDEVTKPSLDELPADIEEIVDGNAVALATGGLASIMVNPVLNPLFTLALIFSTAAYVLFGKR